MTRRTSPEDSFTQQVDLAPWQRAFMDRVLRAGPAARWYLYRGRRRRVDPFARYEVTSTLGMPTSALTEDLVTATINNITTKPQEEK